MGKYTQKSNRGKWSVESMSEAVLAVRNDNVPLLRASIMFGVPRNTLRDRLKLDHVKTSYAKETVLGLANENELVQRIVHLQKKGFGLTITDVRQMAHQFAMKNNVKNMKLFNANSTAAGWAWYRAFMRRNPQISVRSAQNISYARAQCMNKPLINSFFDMYEACLFEVGILTKAQSIYNADESGLQLHSKAGKVLAAKGERSVLQVTNSERGENVTVLACCSASGNFIPPFIVFKGKRQNPAFSNDVPPGSMIAMSDSGYINGDLFLKWLMHFNEHRTPGKVALIIDGHSSHVKNIPVLEYAVEHDIIFISLPPHTTHFMQPLDRSFFRPLKAYYDQACRSFIVNNPGRQITKLQFGKLMSEAWGKAATVATACNGFRACGLFPIDRNAIPEHAYMPALSSDIQPCAAPCSPETLPNPVPSTSGQVQDIPESSLGGPLGQPTQSPMQLSPQTLEDECESNVMQRSFADLQPSPIIVRTQRQGKSRLQKAAILTSSPYRRSLQTRMDEISMKNTKKRKINTAVKHAASKPKTKKKSVACTQSKIDSSNGSSSDDDEVNNLCQDDSDDDVPLIELKKRQQLCKRSVDANKSTFDNCVLCGEFGPGNEWWFRCVKCSSWVHKDCSSADRPDDYECDFCQ
jgi:hypothetical protein